MNEKKEVKVNIDILLPEIERKKKKILKKQNEVKILQYEIQELNNLYVGLKEFSEIQEKALKQKDIKK